MQVRWISTASVLISTEKTQILIDPYLHRYSSLPPFPELDVDAVLITHAHLDHFADIGHFSRFPIYGDWQCEVNAAHNHISLPHFHRVLPYQTVSVGQLTAQAFPSRHVRFDRKLILSRLCALSSWKQFFPAMKLLQQNRAFLIDGSTLAWHVSDGIHSVLVLGSAAVDAQVSYPKCDLLVLAFQGRSDIAEICLEIVEKLQPKSVLLSHYDDAFPPLTEEVDCTEFVQKMKERHPSIPVHVTKKAVSV